MNQEYYRMLGELQAVDFVLVELNLYLDTHPNDPQALQQHNEYSRIRKQLKKQFESCFGPLENFGHSPSDLPYRWKEAPWPWQV